jgi:hypothetical protein
MDKHQRDLKKAWKQAQRQGAQAAFPLPDEVLEELFDYLDSELEKTPCDHSRRLTDAWLTERGHNTEAVNAWLEENNGHCDCEININVEQHWEENRSGGDV